MLHRLCIPGVYARLSLGLGLALLCYNDYDWLIPEDALKCTNTHRPCALLYSVYIISFVLFCISLTLYIDLLISIIVLKF